MTALAAPPIGHRAVRARARATVGPGDRALWIATLLLSGLGLLAIYSATRGEAGDDSFARRQLLFLLGALAVAAVISRLDYRLLATRKMLVTLTALTILALAAVLTPLGLEVRGTRGWLSVFGLTVQPAELAKVTVVLVVAGLFALDGRRRIGSQTTARRFVLTMMVLTMVSALVLAGGETGSVLVYAVVVMTVLAGADVPKRLLGLLLISALAVGALALTSDVLQPYQRDRIESFLDLEADPQGSGYHQRQSLTAIGSGGIAGKGLFNGPQTQLQFLPEQHTDFIFAVVGEELGFVGGLTVIVAQGFVLARVLALTRPRGDRFGELLCLGVFAYLGFQVVQNVAMNLRLLPITGIPLPFVSYGGSSLFTSFIAIGLVQSVARRRGSPFLAGKGWRPLHGARSRW